MCVLGGVSLRGVSVERQYRICGDLAVEFNGVIGSIGVGQVKVDVCSGWS